MPESDGLHGDEDRTGAVADRRITGELFHDDAPKALEPLPPRSRAVSIVAGGALTAVGIGVWVAEFLGTLPTDNGWAAHLTVLILPLMVGVTLLRSGLSGRDLFQEQMLERERKRRERRGDEPPAP